jgi:hypothetical protein
MAGEDMTVEQKTILTSFPGLTLPDGRRCVDLDRFDLARVLVALAVAGVDAGTGIADSLRLYSVHLEEIKGAAVRSYRAAVQATQADPT